jgi:hypothetical protein
MQSLERGAHFCDEIFVSQAKPRGYPASEVCEGILGSARGDGVTVSQAEWGVFQELRVFCRDDLEGGPFAR